MGNVIIDIDFKRVLSVWSNLSGKPLSELSSDFIHGETFKQHECGKISDVEFAEAINDQLDMSLSFDEFAEGWQAIFISVRPDVIDIMNRLREQGHRVVVLSNTNRLHQDYWPQHYPEIAASADFLYLSRIWDCVSRTRISISMCLKPKSLSRRMPCSLMMSAKTWMRQWHSVSKACWSPIVTQSPVILQSMIFQQK